jgi:hypothetical protein
LYFFDIRLDFLGKGSMCGAYEGGILMSDENMKLIKKLHFRLRQARKIAGSAETCAVESCPERTLRLLEEVEVLVRDAGHLVVAAMIMKHPEGDIEAKCICD